MSFRRMILVFRIPLSEENRLSLILKVLHLALFMVKKKKRNLESIDMCALSPTEYLYNKQQAPNGIQIHIYMYTSIKITLYQ